MLNELLAEKDLAKLTPVQRDFLVQRIDHAIDTDAQIREIVAAKLQKTLALVSKDIKVQVK
jgi:hypothetical protein